MATVPKNPFSENTTKMKITFTHEPSMRKTTKEVDATKTLADIEEDVLKDLGVPYDPSLGVNFSICGVELFPKAPLHTIISNGVEIIVHSSMVGA